MKITIKCRWNDKTLFEGEYQSTKEAVVDAVAKKADLQGADLRGTNLRGADLRGTNLRGTNLRGTNLRGADLRGADLRGTNLRWADLRGTNLRWADLQGADLQGADLRGADLRGTNLRGADLRGTNLRWADLQGADLQGEKLKIAPIMMQLDRWDVIITPEYLVIGCQRHTHAEWAKFKRTEISHMVDGAWDWWKLHKDMLMAACAIHKTLSDKIELLKESESS